MAGRPGLREKKVGQSVSRFVKAGGDPCPGNLWG
jgi:hypothetical protein